MKSKSEEQVLERARRSIIQLLRNELDYAQSNTEDQYCIEMTRLLKKVIVIVDYQAKDMDKFKGLDLARGVAPAQEEVALNTTSHPVNVGDYTAPLCSGACVDPTECQEVDPTSLSPESLETIEIDIPPSNITKETPSNENE